MGHSIQNAAQSVQNMEIVGLAYKKGHLPEQITKVQKLGLDRVVIIDFSVADASIPHVKAAAQASLPYVTGVTGLNEKQMQEMQNLSARIPILVAPNMATSVNLVKALAQIAAKTMPWADMEIVDLHHRQKKDAPSGTALWLAKNVALARNQSVNEQTSPNTANRSPRKAHEIGISSLRGGNLKGEHTVYFLGEDERLELKVQVTDRLVYAQGALKAAVFLVDKKPGLYTMANVLNIAF